MEKNENNVFNTLDEAIRFWSMQYRPLSREYEHGAMIYQRKTSTMSTFRIGKTMRGSKGSRFFRPNVVFAFLYSYMIESVGLGIMHHDQIAAFIHTHPEPPKGYSYRHHSKEDLGLLKLKRIQEVIVVPYENQQVTRETKAKPSL